MIILLIILMLFSSCDINPIKWVKESENVLTQTTYGKVYYNYEVKEGDLKVDITYDINDTNTPLKFQFYVKNKYFELRAKDIHLINVWELWNGDVRTMKDGIPEEKYVLGQPIPREALEIIPDKFRINYGVNNFYVFENIQGENYFSRLKSDITRSYYDTLGVNNYITEIFMKSNYMGDIDIEFVDGSCEYKFKVYKSNLSNLL